MTVGKRSKRGISHSLAHPPFGGVAHRALNCTNNNRRRGVAFQEKHLMGADTSGKLLARSSILNFLNDLSVLLFFCLGVDLERGSVKGWT